MTGTTTKRDNNNGTNYKVTALEAKENKQND
jgi:hypothetical protein